MLGCKAAHIVCVDLIAHRVILHCFNVFGTYAGMERDAQGDGCSQMSSAKDSTISALQQNAG